MRLLATILLSTLFLIACKKDKPDEPSIEGRWNAVDFTVYEYENGLLTESDTTSVLGTTFDFQSNGTVVVSDPASGTESLAYSILPDSKIMIDGDVAVIQNLTETSVTLYFRDEYGVDFYGEVFLRLKR
jgi:hypothetical protein